MYTPNFTVLLIFDTISYLLLYAVFTCHAVLNSLDSSLRNILLSQR